MAAGHMSAKVHPIPPGKGVGTNSAERYTNVQYQRLKDLASQYAAEKCYVASSDVYKFFRKYDWAKLKDEFYTASAERPGIYKYPSVESFIKAKWKDGKQQEFAILIIGPYPSRQVPWQGSWVLERTQEHYGEDKRIQRLSQKLAEEASAATISYCTASLYVDEISKLKLWLDQLQAYSGGTLFQTPLNKSKQARDEAKRELKFILNLQGRLLDMLDQVRRSIQDSVGGQHAIMANLVKGVFNDAVNSPVLSGSKPERVKALIERMTEVAIARSDLYQTKLPDLDAIDVEAEGVNGHGKKSVQ